jgi:GT2 family glycosyltransferase
MISCSIIIVNYKSPQLVLDCLGAFFPRAFPPEIEVIVVDNGSNDNSEQLIRTSYPAVKWIAMNYNSGFARANNAGIRVSLGRNVLLLNSDTLGGEEAIIECARRLDKGNYVACGVQLLNPDRSPQVSGNFFITGAVNQLLMLPLLGDIFRRLGYALGVKKTNLPEAKGTAEVDWINGAFLMVKREAIGKAGLLDEDFFLFFEEIEWCSRLRKLGNLCIFGDLQVVHLMGATADKAFDSAEKGYHHVFDRKGLQIMVSALLRVRKQYGIGWFLFHLFMYVVTVPVFFVVALVFLLFPGRRRYTFGQFTGYTRNTLSLLSLGGKMLLNKSHFYKVL